MIHYATLFQRDLRRLMQEIEAYPDDLALWQVTAGISNSAGNLCLHLIGNLNEYIGRQLGGLAYERNRPLEFSDTGRSKTDLLAMVEATIPRITETLNALSLEALESPFPEPVLGYEMSVEDFLVHLFGHLSYHLGQIDYHRRLLTRTPAVAFVMG